MADLSTSSPSASLHQSPGINVRTTLGFSMHDQEDLEAAIAVLRHHGSASVYLFGSMADGSYSTSSDWDFAVEGLPSRAYLPALAELTATLRRPVDLINLDDGSRFASYLRSWGQLLHVA